MRPPHLREPVEADDAVTVAYLERRIANHVDPVTAGLRTGKTLITRVSETATDVRHASALAQSAQGSASDATRAAAEAAALARRLQAQLSDASAVHTDEGDVALRLHAHTADRQACVAAGVLDGAGCVFGFDGASHAFFVDGVTDHRRPLLAVDATTGDVAVTGELSVRGAVEEAGAAVLRADSLSLASSRVLLHATRGEDERARAVVAVEGDTACTCHPWGVEVPGALLIGGVALGVGAGVGVHFGLSPGGEVHARLGDVQLHALHLDGDRLLHDRDGHGLRCAFSAESGQMRYTFGVSNAAAGTPFVASPAPALVLHRTGVCVHTDQPAEGWDGLCVRGAVAIRDLEERHTAALHCDADGALRIDAARTCMRTLQVDRVEATELAVASQLTGIAVDV